MATIDSAKKTLSFGDLLVQVFDQTDFILNGSIFI